MRLEKQGAGKVVESCVRGALDDGRLEPKGAVGDELQLGDEVVEAVGGGADDAVLVADERQQAGQLDIAQGVHLCEDMVVGHLPSFLPFTQLRRQPTTIMDSLA